MDVTKNEYAVVKATYGRAAAWVGEEKIFLEKAPRAERVTGIYYSKKFKRFPWWNCGTCVIPVFFYES